MFISVKRALPARSRRARQKRSRHVTNTEALIFLRWLSQELLSPQLARHVHVQLEWRKCYDEKASCNAANIARPREFDIVCNPYLSWRLTMRCLAHEMVHVHQWATGKTRDYDNATHARWKRTFVNLKRVPYERWPWELEANKLEKELYGRYLRELERQRSARS